MFRKTLIFFSCLFALTCTVAYWNHLHLRKKDWNTYSDLTKKDDSLRARHALEFRPLTQHRQAVQKDFWMPQNHQRIHFRIKSRDSQLLLTECKGKIEAKEILSDLECWLQEPVDPASSLTQIRHLLAKQGSYFYPSQRFQAETVQMQLFRIKSSSLPKELDPNLAFLIGTARTATFSACGHAPTLVVEELCASFDPARGLQ